MHRKNKMAIECYRNILSVIKKAVIDNTDIEVILSCIDKFDSLLEDESNGIEEKLKYVANLREKYPDKSLAFIASKTNVENKLTKSGLKHRLDKIIELSNNYKK